MIRPASKVKTEMGPTRKVSISEMVLYSPSQVGRFPDVIEVCLFIQRIDARRVSDQLGDQRVVSLEYIFGDAFQPIHN